MATDITQTGYQSWRDLKKQNEQPFNPETASAEDWYKQLRQTDYNTYSNQPTEYAGIQAAEAGLGNSQYDEGLVSTSQLQDLGDIRYQNQPRYDTLANGMGKMLGTAGTTFISSLIGLPYGLAEAAYQGRWSALWDNDVTQGLANVDKWLEDNMTNYRSQVQQNSPWYDPNNLFSMNFIADDVIKNMGFTLGAAASMAVGSGTLGLMSKSMGLVNEIGGATKAASNVLSALFSATGEGMIEARQGVEERNKLEMQKLEDSLAPEEEALKVELQQINDDYERTKGQSLIMGPDGKAVDPAYETYRMRMADLQDRKTMLDQKRAAGQQQIEESGKLMGNKILLANQGLLTMGNLIQFSKGMTKSFDSARHAAELSSKTAKPFGVTATRVSNNIKDGYKVVGKNLGRTIAATKGLLTEGSEEMNQQWIQSSSGAAYNEQDVNDYWRAKLDPESYRETTKGLYTMGQILDRGFNESWGDKDQWEQFVIGGLTGLAGSYTPTKLFNQDKTKSRWDPRRYGSWEGGAYNELRDFNRDYNQFSENIDDVNKILQSEDFPARVRSMVGHTYTETEKENAADADDKKAWKDADDKQNIHDIQAFLRAGKLDDLRAIYKQIGSEMTDEDIDNVVKSTTREISAEEDKQQHDNAVDERIAARQREVNALYDELESLQNSLLGSVPEAYDTNRDYVNTQSRHLLASIEEGEKAIEDMQAEKQAYVGQKKYEGAYVDEKGNRTATNDEIKQTVNHNAGELNRKLDSYLDSIDYVNRRTNGQLTKDQEDNLAYLHNMGKESNVRMQKIMAGVRRQLPSKFLLKTSKTPEQLTQENASSDLVFTKDDNTPEGYVEVDTSLMNDTAFADFFQEEVIRGGNIRPEFAETADERAAREEEEKNLPEAERKKKARERATKKWQDALKKNEEDRKEQWETNWDMIVDGFMTNFRKNNSASQEETLAAFDAVAQDIYDASALYNQAGEYYATLNAYMRDPSKIDRDKEKEEEKADKEAAENHAKNRFSGKDAKQIKQELADGTLDIDEFEDFAAANLNDVTDDDLKNAQEEARKAQEGLQKASALKNHIQEQLGDNPSPEELSAAQTAMQMIDRANENVANPEDFNIDNPELSQVPLDMIGSNANLEDIDNLNQQVQGMLAEAFNSLNADQDAQDNIPDEVPSVDGVDMPETGNDPTTKVTPEVVAPKVSQKEETMPLPKSPLTDGAIDTIIKETGNATTQPNTNGTWRSTTTRHPYGRSTGTYHDTISDKNSKEYKRSKAIWEYLNSVGAFDRQDNSDNDRIKAGETIHFMVKYLPEVFGTDDFNSLTEENKPYSLVILMLNDNGEVLGDLPLAQLEPTFKSGNPTDQVKVLMQLQKKVFDAFEKNKQNSTANEAVVDATLHKDGADNLNLTFDNAKKTPLVTKVKQVMRGVVPYRKSEKNTLNEVAGNTPLELGVRISSTNVALKRGDKTQHKDVVVPGVGTTGQPYMLMSTPSGEKIAVPFYMPAFNAEQHRNTELYKLLANAVNALLANNSQTTASQKENFMKHLDVLKGLLQVDTQKGVRIVDVKSDTITLHLQSLTDPNRKYDITVSNASGDGAAIALAMVDKMSGIPINVSLQYLNSTIESGKDTPRKANYNQVIGEIADVNLPKATTHTTNGWFTVELAPSTGLRPSRKITPKVYGKVSENINGKNIEIDIDKMIAVDTSTGEIIEDNEDINLRMAQLKASQPLHKDKDFIQVSINGVTRTYDVKNNKFTKTQSPKTQSPVVSYANQIKAVTSARDLVAIEKKAQEEQANGTISSQDLIQISGLVNQKRAAIYSETPDVSEVTTPKKVTRFEAPEPKKKPAKTIEEIEKEAKDKKILSRQTKDAWAAIPDSLKLRLFNDGVTLQLSYYRGTDRVFKNSVVTISLSNLGNMVNELSKANMAAKAGNMKVTEAVKPMEVTSSVLFKENEKAARRWLAKNLPMLSSEERTQFVDKLARNGDNAGKMWGSYRAGVIEIQRNAPMGTTYHEAFHYVLDIVLSPEERRQILDLAKQEYGVSDDWTAEERLAEDFRKYAMDENAEGIIGRIKRWFRNIMDRIRRYNRISDTTVNQLFWKINNGELAQKSMTLESFDETQQRVLMEIRNIQKDKYSWNALDGNTRNALRESGLSEATYSQMSLEEKQQYVKCRG